MIVLWILLIIIGYFVVGAALAGVVACAIHRGEEEKNENEHDKGDEAIVTVILLALIFLFWPFVGAFALAWCGVQLFNKSKDKKKTEVTAEVK